MLVCMAQFMVILDATIVNVALPSIQADLDMSDADLQWIVNAYTLVFGGFLLLGGRAGDLLGRKRVFLVGVVIFTVASLLNGLAPSSEFLIIFRGVQGLGAALIAPAALSIITTTFAEGPERTKAMGVWAAIAVGGGAVGLVLGGILVDALLVAVDLLRERPGGDRGVHRARCATCPSRRTSARTRASTSRER